MTECDQNLQTHIETNQEFAFDSVNTFQLLGNTFYVSDTTGAVSETCEKQFYNKRLNMVVVVFEFTILRLDIK